MAEVMFCGKAVCIIWHCMIATVDSKFLISLKHSVVFKKQIEHRTKYTAPEP